MMSAVQVRLCKYEDLPEVLSLKKFHLLARYIDIWELMHCV